VALLPGLDEVADRLTRNADRGADLEIRIPHHVEKPPPTRSLARLVGQPSGGVVLTAGTAVTAIDVRAKRLLPAEEDQFETRGRLGTRGQDAGDLHEQPRARSPVVGPDELKSLIGLGVVVRAKQALDVLSPSLFPEAGAEIHKLDLPLGSLT